MMIDRLLIAADSALRTVFAPHATMHPYPDTVDGTVSELTEQEKKHAGALMRVNHVGEVCAQALYTAQAFATQNPSLRQHFTHACDEETQHLAWTERRLQELGQHTSLLNPLWYAGAFGLGLIAGKISDAVSLGFVAETETQVQAHLESHLNDLPVGDHTSRAIVTQMIDDEARHAHDANDLGAARLPLPVKGLMQVAAKVMTTLAHRI